jgi:flagellar hook-basal body complex protein FliE
MIEFVNSISAFNATQKLPQQVNDTSSQGTNFASQLIDVVKQAETAAVGGMQGQLPMQDVVMKVMEAERAFSTAMAIRDKVVGAYLELSRMQI